MVSRGVFPTSSFLLFIVAGMSSTTTTNAFTTPLPFFPSTTTTNPSSASLSDTALYMGKTRKAKKMQQEQQTKGRPRKFLEAMEDAQGKQDKKKNEEKLTPEQQKAEAARQATEQEAQARMDARPDVSTMIVDEQSGIEVLQQGKNVMDVVTRKAVKLSNMGPDYRLAQMFPGVPPHIREQYRFDWKTAQATEMVEALREACMVKLEDGSRGIPPAPSVASKAIDFVLANRDLMGHRMKRTLGRIAMRSVSQGGDMQQAKQDQKLWQHFMLLENHISAPFRQMIMDAEGRVGPNFGNLDVTSYCDGDLYERCANYLVLKGMVAHWEKKVVDADSEEKTPQTPNNYISNISRGDPRRYLPEPPILFTLKECTQVCYMAQQMTKTFVETSQLFDDLPPEVRFLDVALTIKGGTTLRKFMIEEFCPAEEITPEALREGMRRLVAQLENMQVDPYGDIVNILERLIKAMEVGTDDARDPYAIYLANRDRSSPGRFQTYTFNHSELSMVRFLDNQYEGENDGGPRPPPTADNNPLGALFGFANEEPEVKPQRSQPAEESKVYSPPQIRALGRPHELGWLDDLNKITSEGNVPMGKVKHGRIIPDEE